MLLRRFGGRWMSMAKPPIGRCPPSLGPRRQIDHRPSSTDCNTVCITCIWTPTNDERRQKKFRFSEYFLELWWNFLLAFQWGHYWPIPTFSPPPRQTLSPPPLPHILSCNINSVSTKVIFFISFSIPKKVPLSIWNVVVACWCHRTLPHGTLFLMLTSSRSFIGCGGGRGDRRIERSKNQGRGPYKNKLR